MKRKKLRDLALIAEVVSGIAIILTLAFLAFEMRDNTNASQAQTYQILMAELNNYRSMLGEPGMATIIEKRRDEGWDGLSRVEKRRLRVTALINWGIYESAFFANQRGILGQSEWTRFEAAICRRFGNSKHLWAPEGFTPMNELLTSEFADYVVEQCE